jgi:prephenate dehydrogenase
MEINKIAIIGLGLIGGSLARALKEKAGVREIIAVTRSREAIDQAILDGSICRGSDKLDEDVYDSDVIFICTPVKQALRFMEELSGRVKPGCIVTDVGSTKEEITMYAEDKTKLSCFIGGHPMAGTEKSGYASGFVHLFENAYYVLTPCRSTTEIAIECMKGLVKSIGAIPIIMEASIHDRVAGGISHVPHIIASGLVNMVRELDTNDGTMQMLAAGGFRDITRIASSNPEMWENIVTSNKRYVLELLGCFSELLSGFRLLLQEEDSAAIKEFFEEARIFRDSMSSRMGGLISPAFELIVDVEDKPGIIGEIATILGRNNINIKNINVTNSREMEQGCLKIKLTDIKSENIAFDLLKDSGYKVYKNK